VCRKLSDLCRGVHWLLNPRARLLARGAGKQQRLPVLLGTAGILLALLLAAYGLSRIFAGA
jgi:hypothetical protein